jgi:signal transduction histidine kinase
MDTSRVESGSAIFQPRARLLKLIGAELISDEIVALAELVKNAHDADASMVTITFNSANGPDGEIVIHDDGNGMDRDTLLRHWMEPAGTTKAGPDGRFTKSGRRVLGEKGVGRFAADKLARKLELISCKAGHDKEIHAAFDWDEFDSDSRMLSDIECRWEVRRAEHFGHGTLLRLTRLRTSWNERMFKRVSTRLSRLPSPFETGNGFRIQINCNEYPQYSGELRSDFLKVSPHHIDAEFDGAESVDVNLNGAHSVRHLWNGTGDLRCGPVRIRLFAFDLESNAIAKIGPPGDVRAWLREWSGVSIYRDAFRVWPYGEPHDDWLRLDQRRVNNPVVRLSNNQLLGFVEISSERNPDLRDQTNREGLINNRAFQDLRRLVYFLLQILEAERQSIRHPRSSLQSPAVTKSSATDTLGEIVARAPRQLRGELNRVARNLKQEAIRREERYDRLIEGYSDLAALGQAAVKLSALVAPLQRVIVQQHEELEKAIPSSIKHSAGRKLQELQGSLTALFDRLAMLTPMEHVGSGRGRLIDIPTELEMFKSMIDPLLQTSGTRISIDAPSNSVLRVEMRPETLHRVLFILTANSLDWLHDKGVPQIRLSVRATGDSCEIVFSDNGPGIPPQIADKVFEPLFSTREGGKGMGLTIAKDLVLRHHGRIEVLTDGRRRGTHIRLVMPRKRSTVSAR